MATLAEITTAVRDEIGNDDIPDLTIKNKLHSYITNLTSKNNLNLLATEGRLILRANQKKVRLPINMKGRELLRMYVDAATSSRQELIQQLIPYKEFIHYDDNSNQHISSSILGLSFTMFNLELVFNGTVANDVTLHIDYVRRPILPQAPGDNLDEIDPTNSYADMFVTGTKARILQVDEDYEQGREEQLTGGELEKAYLEEYVMTAGNPGEANSIRNGLRARRGYSRGYNR